MATAAEQTFIAAVAAAEQTRQNAKSAAITAFAFVPANQATFRAAISAADVAYFTAVTAALNTLTGSGNIGQSGPIASNWATVLT